MEDSNKYLNGPDQLILEASEIFTSSADGYVKIRDHNLDSLRNEPPLSVPSLLKKSAERFPDHQALVVKRDGVWVDWTYKNYYDDSRIVAKAFIKLGLERFYSVCILGFNSPEWFISQMGAIMAGGFSVGIYTTNSPDACKYIVGDCKANILVVEDEKQLEKILKFKSEMPCLKAIIQYTGEPSVSGVLSWKSLLEIGSQESDDLLNDRLRRIAINQCCALIYTSGTTGPPKGVMMSHDNLTWTARMAVQYLGICHTDSFVTYLPLSHSAAQMIDVWMSMTGAATVYFADKNALKGSLIATLREVRPTYVFGVPRIYEKFQEKMIEIGKSSSWFRKAVASWAKKAGLEHNLRAMEGKNDNSFSYPIAKKLVFKKVKENLGFDRARIIGVGAGPVSRETFEYFLSLDIPLVECYGMSETSGPQTGNRAGFHRLGSVGQSLDGFRTKIVDPDPDGNGEVCMSSRNIMMGYLNRPKDTRDIFDDDGWLHSGDIGCEQEDGFFKITGRIKDLIITSGGENIPPILIEDTIKRILPCVSNAMVVGDKRKFLSCLLTLKVEVDSDTLEPKSELTSATKDWCLEHGIEGKTTDEVLRGANLERLNKAIQYGINLTNQEATSNAQKIQKFAVLPTDFSVPGGELGPTLKVKRHFVLKKYESLIRNMYNVQTL